MKGIFSLSGTVVAATLVASLSASANILPKNNLAAQDGLVSGNVTEEQFNQIADSIIGIWKPLAALHGAELNVVKAWDDSEVNAYAEEDGNQWTVRLFGGLARRAEITPDAFALVVCHELGHHFGGYAWKDGGWAATEGEADYFATQVCARRIWAGSGHSMLSMAGRAQLAGPCDSNFKTATDRELCYRTTEAAISLASLFGALSGEEKPSLDKRDSSEVDHTSSFHPASQCRLDTYLQGALCTQTFDLNVIPGMLHGAKENTAENELEAAKYSCMQTTSQVGYRPRCWFKPLGGNQPEQDLLAWSRQ